MNIVFKSLRLKNLLSYGNNLTELTFGAGLTLVTAKSGDGKSALLLDALSFVLFGKPYRKIKMAELINRINKKGLWVQVEFEIDGKNYILTRGIKPDVLEILIDGQESSLLSSKGLNQEEIDKILGCDYNLFKHVICLSINYNKPFLSLSIPEKRDIVESIFNIKIFAEMLIKIKKELSLKKIDHQINSSEENTLHSSLISLDNQIKSIKKSSQTFEDDKTSELKKLNQELSKLNTKKKSLQKTLTEKESELTPKTDKNKIDKLILDLKTKGISLKASIEQIVKKKKFLKENDVCPVCNSDLDDEHRSKELNQLESEEESLNKEIDSVREKYNTAVAKENEISKANKNIESLEQEITNIKRYDIKNLDDQIAKLMKDIRKVEERKLDFDISSLKNEFDAQKARYLLINGKVLDLSAEMKVLESTVSVLGDRGIKSFFFKKLIPILNLKINTFLDKFDLPVKITFNELMEEHIDSLSGQGRNISYNTFSEGEKKRIDIALMLSFIETTKTICNWDSNILIFDEIFDSAIDSAALDKIMDSIKEMTTDNTDLCCYVISHREADHQNYTGRIVIEKKNGFSHIS